MHSEVVFSLSPNNNASTSQSPTPPSHLTFRCKQIAESFRRFGISPQTTNLLVVKVSAPSSPASTEAIQSHLTQSVEGEQIEFSDAELQSMTDVARIKKIYKLNNSAGVNGQAKGNAVNGDVRAGDENKELEMLILGSMALRGATN